MTENEISYIVRGAIFRIFNALGPGLLESAYETVLLHELRKAGLEAKSQTALPLVYDDIRMDAGYRLIFWLKTK